MIIPANHVGDLHESVINHHHIVVNGHSVGSQDDGVADYFIGKFHIAVDEVDAVIGRLILMHLPDPISTLRQFAGLVRPGGLIAFCEFDIGAVRSIPESPLSRALVDAIVRAFQGVGLDPAFGAALHRLFRRAGLGVPQLTLAAPVGTANDTEVWAYAVEVWRLVFPLAEQLGLVTDELADIDTLLPRTLEQATVADAILMLPPMITAWTTVRSN